MKKKMTKPPAGQKFRYALIQAKKDGVPLHVIGVADGSDALEAEKAGFKAIYISGSQVAAARGWADIGRIELRHLVEHIERILDSGTTLPILVDIDTGFDDIATTIRTLEKLGVDAVHLEDQRNLKVCGHLPDKQVVSEAEAIKRIETAVKAKKNPAFVIMARTDALAIEGLESTLKRIAAYSNAGADMIFAEAFPDPATYKKVKDAAHGKPVLANMTEFGKVALQTPAEIADASNNNVDIVLNPLTVYRAQRLTAQNFYKMIHDLGTQRGLEQQLQDRKTFQSLIGYDKQISDRAALLSTPPADKKKVKRDLKP